MIVLSLEQNEIQKLSLIQSSGGTKDLRSCGNPVKEGANLSEQSNNKRIVLVKNSPLFGGLFLLEIQSEKEKEMKKEEHNGKIIIYFRVCHGRTPG